MDNRKSEPKSWEEFNIIDEKTLSIITAPYTNFASKMVESKSNLTPPKKKRKKK